MRLGIPAKRNIGVGTSEASGAEAMVSEANSLLLALLPLPPPAAPRCGWFGVLVLVFDLDLEDP